MHRQKTKNTKLANLKTQSAPLSPERSQSHHLGGQTSTITPLRAARTWLFDMSLSASYIIVLTTDTTVPNSHELYSTQTAYTYLKAWDLITYLNRERRQESKEVKGHWGLCASAWSASSDCCTRASKTACSEVCQYSHHCNISIKDTPDTSTHTEVISYCINLRRGLLHANLRT